MNRTNTKGEMRVPIRPAPPPPKASKSKPIDLFDSWSSNPKDPYDQWSQRASSRSSDPWGSLTETGSNSNFDPWAPIPTRQEQKGKKKPPPRPPPPKFTNDSVSLIDWNSPPDSPPNTRSNSDALSVNSFGSTSNVESGFEDDPEFSQPKKPSSNSQHLTYTCMKPSRPPTLPTIIRANKQTKTYVVDELAEIFSKQSVTSERSDSPPMPNFPPPAPPPEAFEDELPYAIALFDYEAAATSDLTFRAGDRLTLLKRVDRNWLVARGPNSALSEGTVPANFVRMVKLLPEEDGDSIYATALHTFHPETWTDLALEPGLPVRLLGRIDANWIYGETDSGLRGQFPAAFVDHVPEDLPLWQG